MRKKTLLDLSKTELTTYLKDQGQPKFRAGQIWQWLYQKHVHDLEAMTNVPKKLREQLANKTRISNLQSVVELSSIDGYTTKILFSLPDGEEIEAVLMAYDDNRRTLCISTQAGCAMDCPFCATGQMGFRRNLSVGEIMAQVLYFAHKLDQHGERVSNIVFMGMGEPLA
ncbi:MAG: 23S rRNA (adenine(2503)-C2)-methyltransferase, partial [Chloroflexota bacterium]